jgi:coenzyme F420 hydrogenase subunit delta
MLFPFRLELIDVLFVGPGTAHFPLASYHQIIHSDSIMHISHNTHPETPAPSVVIFGCGNVLLGDDGFGPAVIEALQPLNLPEAVRLIDAGTGIREYLLDYLMLPSLRPELLIIVDAGYQQTGAPGEVLECKPTAIAAQKIHDFSLHQFPTVNLLRELQEETGIEVVLLIAQTAVIPDHIAPGLSLAMLAAVNNACHRIQRIIARYATLEATAP